MCSFYSSLIALTEIKFKNRVFKTFFVSCVFWPIDWEPKQNIHYFGQKGSNMIDQESLKNCFNIIGLSLDQFWASTRTPKLAKRKKNRNGFSSADFFAKNFLGKKYENFFVLQCVSQI